MDLSVEENVKIKAILPYLCSLGFQADELHFEKSFTFRAGSSTYRTDTGKPCRTFSPRMDILVTRNGTNLFIVEVKNGEITISEEDIAQATSYALAVFPSAPFALVTNCREFHLYDSVTRKEIERETFKINDRYEVVISEEARYEALKHFIGYSSANVTKFCEQQVLDHMHPLLGSASDLSKKYIPELHTPCRELTETCRHFLRSDHPFWAIYGDSGMGKTCSLCDLAFRLLEEGRPVLFFRAREIISHMPHTIADDFNWTFSSEQSGIQIIKRVTDLFSVTPLTICIDALDDWPLPNKGEVLDNFVRHCGSLKIKLIVTCTTHVWPQFLSQRGVPSHLSNVCFRGPDNEPGYHMQWMTEEEYFQAIERYRTVYGFTGRFEDRVLSDGRRSPFLLRMFFEVAQKHKMKDLTFSQIEFFNAYYRQTLEKLNDPEIAGGTLREIARCLLENDREYVDLDTAKKNMGLRFDEKLMPALFDYNVLDRSLTDHSETISFYFPIFRDYIVAYHVLKLQELPVPEYRGVVDRHSHNQIFQQALKLFYPMAERDKQDVIDHQLLQNAKKYLYQYRDIIDSLFPNLKKAFLPNTEGEIGFIAEISVRDRELTMYGFRELSEGDKEEVRLVPVDRARTARSNLPYLHGAGALHWISSTKGFKREINTIKEVLVQEIEPQLRDIVKSGRLNESRNRYLLLERLIATVAKYQAKHHRITHPDMILNCLPISFRDIEWAYRYEKAARVYQDELVAEKRKSGEIKEMRHGSIVSFVFHLTDDDKKVIHDRAKLAADKHINVTSNVIRKGLDEADRAIVQTIRDLRTFGIDSITEVILPKTPWERLGRLEWSGYSYDALAAIAKRAYTLFLNEYRQLIETSFGQMANEFTLYSKMPLRCFLVLQNKTEDGDYLMNVYEIRKDGGENEVIVAKADEIEFDDRAWTLSYRGIMHKCESMQGTSLQNFIYGHRDYMEYPVDYRLTGLRNRVYHEIEGDLKKVIEWMREHYGIQSN